MSCLACGGDRLRCIYAKGESQIAICECCELTQVHPLPDRDVLANLYADGYFAGVQSTSGYEEYAAQEREYLATFAEDIRRVSRFAPGGSVLDVGCGYGYFVRQAVAAGYDAFGVDLSPDAIREADRQVPGRVFQGTVNTVQALKGRRFDVIFSSHLIEHITEPLRFLSELLDYLSESGIMVFVTPNIASLLAKVSGARWVSFKLPEHVAYYNPKTISRLFEQAGLEVLAIDSAYQYYSLPFLLRRVRELIYPFGRIVPEFEAMRLFRSRMLRVTSGSLRIIAQRSARQQQTPLRIMPARRALTCS